jgi:succinyl-diaminopimelate desuccinylase
MNGRPTQDVRLVLSEAVEARRDDAVSLAQALIRIPTVNPPGAGYSECLALLESRLMGAGFRTEIVRAHGAPGDCDLFPRLNLVARIESDRPGPCVHFNGHIDVVEPGRGWTFDPFAASISNGRIYGRGAADMKGGIAAAVIAAEALISFPSLWAGAIEISCTADEESGGFGGVAYLAERGYFSPSRVDHVLIPEPLNVDRVCLGHRGVWWAEIETRGRIAHGSMPFLGDCAIRHMAEIISAFERELFPALAKRSTSMPVAPPEARCSTLNLNSIHGGQVELTSGGLPSPCVADSCRLVIDRRILIEETLADVREEIEQLVARVAAHGRGFDYAVRELFAVEPVMTRRDAPIAAATAAAIRSVIGRDAEFVCSPGTYDQKHIDRIGRLKNCIAYGPGILDLAHQPDEYVAIDDLVAAAKVMAITTQSLLSESGF